MDGALLWENRYKGPANKQEIAWAVAVDSDGNVFVTGWSDNETNADCYTAKYAASNGALVWDKRYNGPADGDDWGVALAADKNGNVVVMANSFNGSNNDFYTAKYAAADGALLWEKRYDGPGNGDEWTEGKGIALGSNGMVAIAGSSMGISGTTDIATIAYWENLPPLSATSVPAGIHLQFSGVAGNSYHIERAPASTGPWSIIATPTAPLQGLIEFTDTNPPTGSSFYRTSTP